MYAKVLWPLLIWIWINTFTRIKSENEERKKVKGFENKAMYYFSNNIYSSEGKTSYIWRREKQFSDVVQQE